MQWYPLDKSYGPSGLESLADPDRRVDPYLLWAEASQFKGFGLQRDKRGDKGPMVLAKATSAEALRSLCSDARYVIPEVYRGGAGRPEVSFFTAHVAANDLDALIADARVEAVELAVPVLPRALLLPGAAPIVPPDVPRSAAVSGKDRAIASAAYGDPGAQRVIGVIDYGCPFLHRQFRRAGEMRTRILRLWDQGPERDGDWQVVRGFVYGRELHDTQIDAELQSLQPVAGRSSADELEIYRRFGYLFREERPTSGPYFSIHGGHVLHAAAGLVDPLTGLAGDAAGNASIIFVQLPLLAAMDSSGGSLQAYALDGLHYIVSRAADAAELVVNLSFGTQAGPHDGSSLIERAIDELVDACQGRLKVVLPAGNARLQRAHVECRLDARRPRTLRWRVPAEDTSDSFLEIWYPKDAEGVLVRFTSPQGQCSDWVSRGASAFLAAGPGSDEAVAGVVHRRDVPSGARSMILLALAPTQAPEPSSDPSGARPPRATVADGVWTVELALDGKQRTPVDIDAWIERDEPGRGGAKTIGFFEASGDSAAPTTRRTLGSYATGRRTLIVGAARQSDGRPERYSSEGAADGRGGPHLLAAASENEALPGIRSAAVRSEDTERMSGTSMAAPAAARRLFNLIGDRASQRAQWRGLVEPVDIATALLDSPSATQALWPMALRTPDSDEP